MLAVATGIEPGKAVSLIESNIYNDYYLSLGADPQRLQHAISAAWDEIWIAAQAAARTGE